MPIGYDDFVLEQPLIEQAKLLLSDEIDPRYYVWLNKIYQGLYENKECNEQQDAICHI